MKSSIIKSLSIASLLLALQTGTAFAKAAVEFTNKAEVDAVVMVGGKKTTQRVVAKKVVPGNEIIYTTTFKNTINQSISNIVITNPVPANVRYVANSATGNNTVITYSVDGGKNFAAADKLTVKAADGKLRAAQASDFTDIRWIFKGDLAAEQSSDVGFKAVIK